MNKKSKNKRLIIAEEEISMTVSEYSTLMNIINAADNLIEARDTSNYKKIKLYDALKERIEEWEKSGG